MSGNMSVPVTSAGIAKAYGVSANDVNINGGKITIKFGDGRTKTLDVDQVEEYMQAYCRVHQDEMTSNVNQDRVKKQKANAKVVISPDGETVRYTIKAEYGMNVQDFMELYNIKEGTFRPILRKAHLQAKEDAAYARSRGEDMEPYYDEETGETVMVPNLNYVRVVEQEQDGFTTKYYYSDGIIEEVGLFSSRFDYTDVTLPKGASYTIETDQIKDKY